MTPFSIADNLEARLKRLPTGQPDTARGLALYACAVTLADEEAMSRLATAFQEIGTPRSEVYETVLQSYLFLGFPRMLIAAENLARSWPAGPPPVATTSGTDFEQWKNSGTNLYSRVYGNNAQRLRDRVISFAPEIFDWMIVEGYGKVLSRPGLSIAARELVIVAFLTVENRPKQLMSHIRGALLVGVTPDQLIGSIGDIEEVAPDGAREARRILAQLGVGR